MSFVPSPHRLLLVSAMVVVMAVGVLFWILTEQWKMQYINEGRSLAIHTEAEHERMKAIENTDLPVLPPRAPEVPPPNADAALLRTVEALRRRIEERYDITILLFDASFLKEEGIDAHPYPLPSLQEHLKNLNDWIRMYPPEYIKQSGLKTIALFKGWEQHSVQTSGFLIDRSTIGLEAIPTVFHHELFHLADMNDGGLENENADWLRAKYGDNIPEQPAFDALHAIAKNLYMTERPEGFMNAYGKYGGVDEDQATVAEYLLSYPELITQLVAEDAILAAAVREMKLFFFVHSGGLMDDVFWADQQAKKQFDEAYWDARRSTPHNASAEFQREQELSGKLTQARALVSSGKLPQAEALYVAMMKEGRVRISVVHELGALYERQKNYKGAIELYERFLNADNDPSFNLKMAKNLQSLGRTEEAIANYTIAFKSGYLVEVEREDFVHLYEQYAADLLKNGRTAEAKAAQARMKQLFY